MGNSASNSKDKKKKKRTLPSKDKNNDDDEEWEYEYEYVEVDEAPANIKSGISAVAKSNFQKPTKNQGLKRNSRPLKQNFDQFKKPIRNSLKFVRNYANILHKFYVDTGFTEDETWIRNLETKAPNHHVPFYQMMEDKNINRTVPKLLERVRSQKLTTTEASKPTGITKESLKVIEEAEGDFIKTTFRRSEPSMEEQKKYFSQEKDIQEDMRENRKPQEEYYEGQNERFSEKSRISEPPQNEVYRNRNQILENNKMMMYENYLEQVLADKPGRIQNLLLQKYYGEKKQNNNDSLIIPNRMSNAMRQMQNTGDDSERESYINEPQSFIVRNLQNEVDGRLKNPQPILLTEQGVKMIVDKSGRNIPLKLIKFIKEPSVQNNQSVNYMKNNQNNNIAYLADKYQLNNYIQKQGDIKKKGPPKDYTKLKAENLWPKTAKLTRPTYELNEHSRISREVDSIQHSLNYTVPKHHPRNINFKGESTLQPKWGDTPKSSTLKLNQPKPSKLKLSDKPVSQPTIAPANTNSNTDPKRIKELVQKALGTSDYD